MPGLFIFTIHKKISIGIPPVGFNDNYSKNKENLKNFQQKTEIPLKDYTESIITAIDNNATPENVIKKYTVITKTKQ